MTGTATLTIGEFILARLDDDERAAREAVEPTPVPAFYRDGEPSWETWAGLDLDSGARVGSVFLDPARMLSECKAKRLLAREALMCGQPYEGRILKYLALPYADHPDYREEWRP